MTSLLPTLAEANMKLHWLDYSILAIYCLFVVGIGLGLTRWDRVFSFLITAGYSFGVMILLYPLINKIGLIGGTTWKE